MTKGAQEVEVKLGAEVVRVGNEGVLDALGEETVQPAGTEQGRVEVTMAGRAPFEVGIGRPDCRFQRIGKDFGDPVLHEFHFLRVVESVGSVFGEVVEGVFAGGERVH